MMGKLTAATVLGIVGGVLGILSALAPLFFPLHPGQLPVQLLLGRRILDDGGMAASFQAAEPAGLFFVAVVFVAVVGIVGGALAESRPSWSAGLQLFSCLAGFAAVPEVWLMAGPLLLLGAAFAFAGRGAGELTAATVLGIVGGVLGILSALEPFFFPPPVALLLGRRILDDGGMAASFQAPEPAGMFLVAVVFVAVVGIVGGALAESRPSWSAGLQLFSCLAGFAAVPELWLTAGPLLLLGAAFAFDGRRAVTQPPRAATATSRRS